MQQFQNFFSSQAVTDQLTAGEAMIMLLVGFLLLSAVALVYRATYRGVNYRQSTAQTIVVLGMLVSVIMAVIGSNIASAFTLVGAMSVIRFRNSVRETRDVAFIFFAMALGMALGTRFFGLAAVATVGVSAGIIAMDRFDLFAPRTLRHLVTARVPVSVDPELVLAPALAVHTTSAELVSIDSARQGELTEAVYVVTLAEGTTLSELASALRHVNGGEKVAVSGPRDPAVH